jgi:ribosome modulation factor
MAKKANAVEEQRRNVNPDDVAACFAEYTSLRGDLARVQQKVAATLARYEKQGVDPKAIKHAYAEAQKDPAEAAAQHRKNVEYLAMLEIIDFGADGQGSFAAGLDVKVAKPGPKASEGLRVARAHSDAYNTALAGGTKDACPHEPASREWQAWHEGFSDGAADRLARHPEKATVTQAEPRKRGRPPGSGKRQEAAEPAMEPA